MKLQGIFISVATPFDHRGEIWPIKVEHNVAKWNRTGVAGYVLGGAASENASLSSEEQRWPKIRENVNEAIRVREVRAVFPDGSVEVMPTPAAIRRAQELGLDLILIAPTAEPPVAKAMDYGQWTHENKKKHEAERMFDLVSKYAAPEKLVIAAEDLPGLIDKVPGIAKAPGGLCLSDADFASSLAAGAAGIVSTIANAAPYTMISIWEAHRTRDTEAAADWQNRIAKAVEIINGPNGIAALKYAMDLNGYYGGPPRLPQTVLTPSQKMEVEQAFAGIKG